MKRFSLFILAFTATTSTAIIFVQDNARGGAQAELHKLETEVFVAVEEEALKTAQAELEKLEAEVETSVKALRQNMTLKTAMESLSKSLQATPALVSMLEELVYPQRKTRGPQFLSVKRGNKRDPYA